MLLLDVLISAEDRSAAGVVVVVGGVSVSVEVQTVVVGG